MEGRRIVMADGTELIDSEIGYADGKLWCFLKNISFSGVYLLFSDPQKTSTLIFDFGDMQKAYEGFTELSGIMKAENGVDVQLMKPQEVQENNA